jgi:hypothetical protein
MIVGGGGVVGIVASASPILKQSISKTYNDYSGEMKQEVFTTPKLSKNVSKEHLHIHSSLNMFGIRKPISIF